MKSLIIIIITSIGCYSNVLAQMPYYQKLTWHGDGNESITLTLNWNTMKYHTFNIFKSGKTYREDGAFSYSNYENTFVFKPYGENPRVRTVVKYSCKYMWLKSPSRVRKYERASWDSKDCGFFDYIK